jgi:hypothetical protein
VVIFRHVFAKEQANSETIYLLVGFSFASAYPSVKQQDPRVLGIHLLQFEPFEQDGPKQ